jgi:hypothetical protein
MDDSPIFELAIANIINLINDVGYKNVKIVVLANGYAVKNFVKECGKKYYDTLRELNEKGVKFYVCKNALKANNIRESSLFEFCEVVPAGVTKLIELQMNGYTYVKP